MICTACDAGTAAGRLGTVVAGAGATLVVTALRGADVFDVTARDGAGAVVTALDERQETSESAAVAIDSGLEQLRRGKVSSAHATGLMPPLRRCSPLR